MEEIVNNWHERTKKLFAYSQDNNNTPDMKWKAFILATKMQNNVVNGIIHINYLRSQIGMNKFEIGGYVSKNGSQSAYCEVENVMHLHARFNGV